MDVCNSSMPPRVKSNRNGRLPAALIFPYWRRSIQQSYAPWPLSPVATPEIVLSGATLPLAVLPYTRIALSPFATMISLFIVSTAMFTGLISAVDAPEIVRSGATLPPAVLP